MSGWRAALRLARRDCLRDRRRSLLALVLIALPVAGVVALDVVTRTQEISVTEDLDRRLGAADAAFRAEGGRAPVTQTPTLEAVTGVADGPPARLSAAVVRALLGPRAGVLERRDGPVRVRTRIGALVAEATELPLGDPATRGLLTVAAGRLPQTRGEVAVSPALARRGFSPGARLALAGRPPASVVGIVGADSRERLSLTGLPGTFGLRAPDAARELLVSVPGGVSWPQVRAANRRGLTVLSRRVVTHPPPSSAVDPAARASSAGAGAGQAGFVLLAATIALLEVVLLAGPAFAVGSRRMARTLALMAAAGGERRHLRRAVLATGVVLGLGAAAVGTAVGVGAAAIAVPLLERSADAPFGPFEVRAADLLLVAGLGFASAVIAAAAPAWVAARRDVLATLAGRRGDPAPGRRSPLLGTLLLLVGAGVAVAGARRPAGGEGVIAVAAVLAVLGMLLSIGVVITALARAAVRLPLPLRYALRDAARQRGRTVPAVAAVAATVVGVVALGIGASSDARQRERTYTAFAPPGSAIVVGAGTESWTAARAAVRRALPGARVLAVRGVPDDARHELRLGASGPPLHNAALGTSLPVARRVAGLGFGLRPAAARRADATLARGGIVVLGRVAPAVRATSIAVWRGDRRTRALRAPAAVLPVPRRIAPAQAILAPGLARRLRLPVRTVGLLATGVPIGRAAEAELGERLTAISPDLGVVVERGPGQDDSWLVLLALAGVAAALMLAGTVTAAALALADAAPDLATLTAVGAGPAARRSIAAAHAAVIAFAGAVLGALVGALVGVAATFPLTSAASTGLPPVDASGAPVPGHVIDMPWLLLGAVVVLLPALAAAVVGLGTRPRAPAPARGG